MAEVFEQNRMTLCACLLEKSALRKSINGAQVVDVLLSHSSLQIEHGAQRQVQFELPAVAMGAVAEIMAECSVGALYKVQGFLNKRSLKSSKLRLHITHITAI